MSDMSRQIIVKVKEIRYPRAHHNPSGDFKVFVGEVYQNLIEPGSGEGKFIVITGNCDSLIVGSYYLVIGNMFLNKEYRKKSEKGEWQISATGIEEADIMDKEGMVNYLASECQNVGKSNAKRIIEAYPEGTDLPHAIRSSSDPMKKAGISDRIIDSAIEWAGKEHGKSKIKKLLYSAGATQNQISKILSHFGDDTARVLSEDCYGLTDIKGFGFLKTDKIAIGLGVKPDSPERVRRATMYLIEEYCTSTGSTRIEAVTVARSVMSTIGVGRNPVFKAIQSLIKNGDLVAC